MTESCSNRTADFHRIRWYVVPGSTVPFDGSFVSAYWSPKGFIVVAESLATAGSLIRHEMLHAILAERGHARAVFLASCAGIVDCDARCAREAGEWKPPSPYAVVSPQSLEIAVVPQVLPAEADGQSWVTLTVRASNRGGAVVIDPGALQGFGFIVNGLGRGGVSVSEPVVDSSSLYFPAASHKEWIFDFVVTEPLSQYSIPEGEYLVRGGFGQTWSDTARMIIDRSR
jgi:hypothetical protein